MALAETARLVASLELQDKFSKPAAGVERSLGNLERKSNLLGKIGGQVSAGVGAAVNNLKVIGVAAAGVLAANVTAGVQSLAKLESAQAQTQVVLKSTRGAAGQTADSVRNLAEKYEGLNATIDDKVIQSAENLLLTFTNVRKNAFEPVLAAALDVNQRLGGGEEGLQGIILKLGRAFNDPAKGMALLARSGVTLDAKVQKQIISLQKQGKLYEGQKLLLDELSKRYGGSFARAGDTAAGKFAKVKDAVEDAQMALAKAFLPVLGKVADKVNTLLSDKTVLARIEGFGDTLAGAFDKLLTAGGQLPWGAIGDAFRIVGTGSKALLDAFVSLPPWVQTAVLTGWGLNKLTGGALGNIAGTLGKSLLGEIGKGFFQRGGTPATPLFVADVTGGLGKGVPGVPGGGPNLLGIGLAVGGGALAGNFIGNELIKGQVDVGKNFEDKVFQGTFQALEKSGNREAIAKAIGAISQQLNPKDLPSQIALALDVQGVRSTLEGQLDSLDTLLARVDSQTNTYTKGEQGAASQRARAAAAMARLGVTSLAGNSAIRSTAAQTQGRLRTLEGVERGVSGNTAAIAKKNFSPKIDVTVPITNVISATAVQNAIVRGQVRTGTGRQEGF